MTQRETKKQFRRSQKNRERLVQRQRKKNLSDTVFQCPQERSECMKTHRSLLGVVVGEPFGDAV